MVLISVIIMVVLLLSGFWIGLSLAGAGIFNLFSIFNTGALKMAAQISWNVTDSFILTGVPLFVFLGELILRGGLSQRLYHGASTWLRSAPGGLVHTNIAACAIFAAITGSSVACAATVSSVAYPELEKRGYDRKLVLGSLAAGGTLGILIPPSIPFIIYGSMVEESVGQLFMAGVIPGLMLAALFSTYVFVMSLIHPHLTPKEKASSWKEKLLGIKDGWQVGIIMLVVLGGIYAGVATPTEAAALGVTISIVMVAVNRQLKWQPLKESLLGTIQVTCMVMLIVVSANILTYSLNYHNIPELIRDQILSFGTSRWLIFFVICIVYFILGMFFDGISMMVITIPILYPIIIGLGFDTVWFGVILVILIEIGLLTPPVAMNLYVLQGISGRPLSEVAEGSLPFMGVMAVTIALLAIFPSIALWLPAQMIR